MLRWLGCVLLGGTVVACGQTGTFDLVSGGKSIGKCTYTLAPVKGGFRLTERYTYRLGGYDTQIAEDLRFDGSYAYLSGSASNVSTQAHTSFVPNKARTELVLGMSQAGGQEARHLTVKPNFVLMPGYDPGAMQAVVLEAVAHPTADNIYNVVIPYLGMAGPPGGGGSSGSSGGSKPPTGSNSYDALWTKVADVTATIDGRPIRVHTYTLKGGKASAAIYADDGNVLMQADVVALKTSYVRSGFKLDTPSILGQ